MGQDEGKGGLQILIDIHVHANKTRTVSRPNLLSYTTPAELVKMMDDHGIDMALVMCRMNPECAYRMVTPEEMLEIVAQYPKRLIPTCNFDPRMAKNAADADFRSMLEFYKKAGHRSIGEYVPNLPFDDPLNMNAFKQMEEVGLPVTFHIAPKVGGFYGCYDDLGLPRLEKVLKACPRLKMFGHSQPFWAEISADVTEKTRSGYPKGKVTPGRLVQLFRACPNLYGDLSAGSGFNAISRDPDFGYQFLEEFQDRLFFGTDICYVGQKLDVIPWWREAREKMRISEQAHEKISWKNANRELNLGLA
jgi:predicted TIM-barrel fold metal-dependent hydrolase